VSLICLQWALMVDVAIYWVVTAGLTLGLAQAIQLSDESGEPPGTTDHWKLPPPTASTFTESSGQIEVSFTALVAGHTYIGMVKVCASRMPGGSQVLSLTVTFNIFKPLSLNPGVQVKQPVTLSVS